MAVESLAHGRRVEPESRSRSAAEADRVQLASVFVHPGALDSELSGKGRGVHEATSDVRLVVGVDQLDDTPRDGIHIGAVDGGLCASRQKIGVRPLSISAIHSRLLTTTRPDRPRTFCKHGIRRSRQLLALLAWLSRQYSQAIRRSITRASAFHQHSMATSEVEKRAQTRTD
jgi:hypothetical protein